MARTELRDAPRRFTQLVFRNSQHDTEVVWKLEALHDENHTSAKFNFTTHLITVRRSGNKKLG